ncbi:Nodulation receptor kinase [Monoraphidium neglectum]|uniref:Nodulation receptor kinase n=1 Tax=Monoraphidium neglectum TaxID=145388 RepID=A0A0D2NID9_9CHLO|nr:Nodulation receptor kinase [Monoraphidium neglectum]KIZ04666.1 Nodulation receptor kinase [Monoraphidium neglectum]|eukprot:XP_013903685.1 Nodulation receptor kinase [Monoraphidium neglectum]
MKRCPCASIPDPKTPVRQPPWIFDVFLSTGNRPADAPAAGASAAMHRQQRAAVFSTTHLVAGPDDVKFNFVGRQGPKNASAAAPLRVAPPDALFLNNQFCWPLGATGSGDAGRQQQAPAQMAVPARADYPHQLKVEFLPIELEARAEDQGAALFAANYNQFYFKVTLNDTSKGAVPLDQIVISYWFNGPEDMQDQDASGNVSAELAAAQFRLACSDASPAVGCDSLMWNVTPGLPGVFGARFRLNVWAAPAAGTLVAPGGGNASAARLTEFEAIVSLEPRRFFANMNSSNDYSWLETPRLPGAPPAGNASAAGGAAGRGANGTDAAIVRRALQANPRMPAFLSGVPAWGSPPKAAPAPPGAAAAAAAQQQQHGGGGGGGAGDGQLPPGSYCRPTPAGAGRVCGVSMTYCCFGTARLAAAVPQDWPERLFVDDAAALNSSDLDAISVLLPADPNAGAASGGGGGAAAPTPPAPQQGSAAETPAPGPSAGIAGLGNGGGNSGGGSGGGSMPTSAAVAVAVALPVVLLAAASGALFALRRRRRRREGQYEKQLLQKEPSRPQSHGDVEWGPPGGVGGGGSHHPSNGESDVLSPLPPQHRAPPDYGPQIARTLSNGASWLANLLGVSPAAIAASPPAHLPLLPITHAGPQAGAAAAAAGAGGAAQAGASLATEGALSRSSTSSDGGCDSPGSPAAPEAGGAARQHPRTVIQPHASGPPLLPLSTPPPAAAALAAALAADPHTLSVCLLGACKARAAGLAGTSGGGSGSFEGSGLLRDGHLCIPGQAPVPLNVDFQAEIEPRLGRVMGRGGYGVVYEAMWRGQKVAVKLLSVDSDQLYEAFMKEVALCACFRQEPCTNSPHVVKLLGACLEDKARLALIMELCEGGNLAQRIYSPSKRRLDHLEILKIAADITTGLAYLHPSVVHRDLKPQNVLLDRQGCAKIADFGISRHAGGAPPALLAPLFKDPHRSYLSVTHAGGTPNYMAPELFNGSRVDEAADVYSLGCILYECLARRQPFAHLAGGPEGNKSYNVLFKIIVAVAIAGERPALPDDAPPRMADLIRRCWREDPRQRPTVMEVLENLESQMQDLPSSGAGGVPLAAAAAGHELQWLEARDAEEHGASSSTGSSGAHPASLVGTGRADAGLPAGALVGGGSTKSGAERGLGVVAAGVESPVVHPSAARRVHFAHP